MTLDTGATPTKRFYFEHDGSSWYLQDSKTQHRAMLGSAYSPTLSEQRFLAGALDAFTKLLTPPESRIQELIGHCVNVAIEVGAFGPDQHSLAGKLINVGERWLELQYHPQRRTGFVPLEGVISVVHLDHASVNSSLYSSFVPLLLNTDLWCSQTSYKCLEGHRGDSEACEVCNKGRFLQLERCGME